MDLLLLTLSEALRRPMYAPTANGTNLVNPAGLM